MRMGMGMGLSVQQQVAVSGEKATGGVVKTVGSYTYHIFESDGTFTPNTALNIGYLVVGAGGSGVATASVSGGGGGGRVLTGTLSNHTTPLSITIGTGAGVSATVLISGQIEAMRGGDGGAIPDANGSGGGCGGGSGCRNVTGSGTLTGGAAGNTHPSGGGDGNNGAGVTSDSGIIRTGAGGGGTGGAGTSPTARSFNGRGRGGAGKTYADFANVLVSNATALFGGGGDGGSDASPYVGNNGVGSHGYGGRGGSLAAGTTNGNIGGDGIVILRYLT